MVSPTAVLAAGCASMAAALFTSRLGVAGTLIGAALASMIITFTSAFLNFQIGRASTRISGLGGNMRERLATRQIRIPGRDYADTRGEPDPAAHATSGKQEGRSSRLMSSLAAFRSATPPIRRRILLVGAVTGLAATTIGMSGVTGIELAANKSLPCLIWESCPTTETAAADGSVNTRPSILGGSADQRTTGDNTLLPGEQDAFERPGEQDQRPLGQPENQQGLPEQPQEAPDLPRQDQPNPLPEQPLPQAEDTPDGTPPIPSESQPDSGSSQQPGDGSSSSSGESAPSGQ